MIIFSGALIGFLHSMAPGHWLPIVLLAKVKKWTSPQIVLASLVASSGHILLSILLTFFGIGLGEKLIDSFEARLESYGGLLAIVFGLIYGGMALFMHRSCGHDHAHHGETPPGDSLPGEPLTSDSKKSKKSAPLMFLFSIGLSPCVAALPVFAAAAPRGHLVLVATMISFALGVMAALGGSAYLVSKGIMNLDHPWIEHHGDALTGGCVALIGLYLFLFPH